MGSEAFALEGFSEPALFTDDTARRAPSAAGVHVVVGADGTPVHVGSTGDLRRRLRQHLRGGRDSSVLLEQVGAELDRPHQLATSADIADWLGGCTVSWRLSEDPQQLKAQLVEQIRPRFNRAVELPSSGIWWGQSGAVVRGRVPGWCGVLCDHGSAVRASPQRPPDATGRCCAALPARRDPCNRRDRDGGRTSKPALRSPCAARRGPAGPNGVLHAHFANPVWRIYPTGTVVRALSAWPAT